MNKANRLIEQVQGMDAYRALEAILDAWDKGQEGEMMDTVRQEDIRHALENLDPKTEEAKLLKIVLTNFQNVFNFHNAMMKLETKMRYSKKA